MFGLSKPPSKAQAAAVRAQQQNQAPDSIPGMFKPGEFVLPPDTVHAMGGKQALQGIVDATHTPVQSGFGWSAERVATAKPSPGSALGFRPEVFFANGGAPEDQTRLGLGLKPAAAPSPSNTFPGSRLPGDSGSTSAPAVVAPAAAPATANLPTEPNGGFSYQENNRAVGEDIKRSWNAGNYGEAVGKTVAGTIGALTTPVIDGALKTAGGVAGFGRGLFGMGGDAASPGASTVSAPSSGKPASASTAAAPAAPAAAGLPAGAGRGSVNPPPANPAAPAPTSTTPAAATEVSPGVFRSGNSFGDSAQAVADIQSRPAGLPSRQNMAAADALAARSQQDSLARGFQPGQGAAAAPLTAPAVSHSGNDWAARQRLKDLETAASSITNRPEWRSGSSTPAWGNRQSAGIVDPDGKIGRFNAALQADLAAQGKAPELQQRTNEVNAGLQRAAMAEAGANERNAADNATRMADVTARGLTDRGRLALEQSRAAMDNQVRGFEVRGAQRQEQLQQRYAAAKTDQERQGIAKEIRDLSGKPLESPWKVQVTPAVKNVDGSTTEGSIYRYNTQTGEVQQVGQQSGAKPVPPPDAIALLKSNPSMAQKFDEFYGAGAAKKALG